MATQFVRVPCDVTGLLRNFKCPGGGGGVPRGLMLKLRIVYLQTLTRYASGLKTLISCINNFKRLTHKSVQIVSLHMINNVNSISFPRKCSK